MLAALCVPVLAALYNSPHKRPVDANITQMRAIHSYLSYLKFRLDLISAEYVREVIYIWITEVRLY